jgi:hypothetical protein
MFGGARKMADGADVFLSTYSAAAKQIQGAP